MLVAYHNSTFTANLNAIESTKFLLEASRDYKHFSCKVADRVLMGFMVSADFHERSRASSSSHIVS